MNFAEVKAAIDKAIPEITRGVVKACAIEWRKTVHKNFESKGRPSWPSRKKISKRQRGTNILVISGALKNVSTVPDLTLNKVTLSADPRAKAYAQIQNEGGTIDMPAREIRFRNKRTGGKGEDGKSTTRSVFASSKQKASKTVMGKAYSIRIPARQFTNVPQEDFPRWVSTMKKIIKL